MGKRYSTGNLANSSLGQYLDHLSVAVMPQDGHLDPSRTMEVSRPKQAHTQHFTLGSPFSFGSFTNFSGKIRLPVVLLGNPGGVKLGKLAGITESGGRAPLSSHWCRGEYFSEKPIFLHGPKKWPCTRIQEPLAPGQ